MSIAVFYIQKTPKIRLFPPLPVIPNFIHEGQSFVSKTVDNFLVTNMPTDTARIGRVEGREKVRKFLQKHGCTLGADFEHAALDGEFLPTGRQAFISHNNAPLFKGGDERHVVAHDGKLAARARHSQRLGFAVKICFVYFCDSYMHKFHSANPQKSALRGASPSLTLFCQVSLIHFYSAFTESMLPLL